MTNAERILEALRASAVPLDDDELSRRCNIRPRQQVNQICRRLATEGAVIRTVGLDGKIVNAIRGAAGDTKSAAPALPSVQHREETLTREPTPALGSSREQRQAEGVMLTLLGQRLGVTLAPRRLTHLSGAFVEVDGVSNDLSVLVECWAHQGAAKVAQKYKLVNDATKLAWIAKSLATPPARLILCVSDEDAVSHLRGRSWQAAAIHDLGVEIEVVDLPPKLVDIIRAAQKRQYR